jgi:hypothetical protein
MPLILNDWAQILAAAPWVARSVHRMVTDGTYMYLTGGWNAGETPSRFSDVWRSADGIHWEQLTDDGGYGARSAHGFLYFNNRFWIMGGNDGTVYLNDVWVSDDCINWTRVRETSPWSIRHEFGLCEFNGRMVITGGYGSGVPAMRSDIWSSDNGMNWTNDGVNVDAARKGPREHPSIDFLNLIWVFGGDLAIPALTTDHRIYNSPTGAIWTYQGDAAWTARREHQLVMSLANDEIAIVGGYDGVTALNDVWHSFDGINWTQIAQLNSFSIRSDFGLINLKGKTFIVGGIDNLGNPFNDVWSADFDLFCDFIGVPTSGLYPLTVKFTSEITGSPTSYLWNFGDGKTSIEENPTHRYDAPGIYTVSLTVTNESGSYTETKKDYITVTLDFTGTPRSGIRPLEVAFKL